MLRVFFHRLGREYCDARIKGDPDVPMSRCDDYDEQIIELDLLTVHGARRERPCNRRAEWSTLATTENILRRLSVVFTLPNPTRGGGFSVLAHPI